MASKLIDFTPNQREAVDQKNGNCLVSAGAGSGKTAVLTERIYWLVVPPLDPKFAEDYRNAHDGVNWSPDHKISHSKDKVNEFDIPPVFLNVDPLCSLDELLVLTFTKAAAYEMKERTRGKLAAYSNTDKYLAKIEQSDITNFDSFYLKTVNEHYFDLGLPKPVTILDTAFVKVLTKKFIEEALEECYIDYNQSPNDSFKRVLENFTGKDDEAVINAIEGVLNLASLSGDEASFFANYEAYYFSPSYVDKVLSSYHDLIAKTLVNVLDLITYSDDNDVKKSDKQLIQNLINQPDFEAMQSFYAGMAFARAKNMSDEDKDIREKVKGKVKVFKDILTKGRFGIEQEIDDIKNIVLLFLRIAKKVYEQKETYMKERSAYDFEGVARLMRKLLEKDDFRKAFQKKYRYIMVDEYQDTSNAQEIFLNTIAVDNVFAVGDIKQSIYRFRKANPKVFSEKMERYENKDGGILITLPENFRSREEVLNGINTLFRKIMVRNVGGVDYRNGHSLNFGNHSFDATAKNEDYGLEVIDFDRVNSEPTVYTEAKIIARDISNKIAQGYKLKRTRAVIGEDGQPVKNEVGEVIKTHACSYGDFAILTARKGDFGQYIKAFKEEGIPLSVEDTYKVDEDDVVLVFKSLLRILIDIRYGGIPNYELDPCYVGVARSFLFREKDDVIYKVYKSGDLKAFSFYPKLKEIAYKLDSLNMEEVFLTLIEELDVLNHLVELGDVEINFQKIEKLANLASSMEKNGFGIREFVSYLNDLSTYEIKLEVEGGAREKDAVVLMSDHHSKGLQFPICYFPELYRQFKNENKSVSFTSDFGIVGDNLLTLNNGESALSFLSSSLEKAESLSERMRLFYVALTRAEEKIIILNRKPKEDETWEDITPRHIEDSKSFQDFFLYGLYGGSYLLSFPTREVDLSFKPEKKVNAMIKPLPENYSFDRTKVERKDYCGEVKPFVRASKELVEPIDPSILVRGNRLHKIMEYTSFKERRLPPLEDKKEREMFEKLFRLPLFENAHLAKEFHEYEFYDEEKDLHGIIDMFLLYDDHIDLIDFKTATIDPDAYQGQLNAYESYLKGVFKGKTINKYLLSLTRAEVNRVN